MCYATIDNPINEKLDDIPISKKKSSFSSEKLKGRNIGHKFGTMF